MVSSTHKTMNNTPVERAPLGPQPTLRAGSIKTGSNHRQKFTPEAMRELEDSIRAQGLKQPILVRPMDDGYELVAGERRLRAFITVYGPDAMIPVYIQELTDVEAAAAAAIENNQREGETPVEQAEAAAKVLALCKGDRAEAAKRLGWDPAKLHVRLGLMHAIAEVRQALQDDKILLGHAELLAGLSKEAQSAALTQMLGKPGLISVAELKAFLESKAGRLNVAIFDTADCTSCPHNSGEQGTLFTEAIQSGSCTNTQCYKAKTETEIQARADALKEDFQKVRIIQPGDNFTIIRIAPEGSDGVGEEQAKACKLCENYGAAVSAVPDKLGRTYKGMCMDTTCHTKHAAAYKKSLQPAPAAAKPASVGTATEPVAPQGAVVNTQKAAGSAKDKPAKATAAAPSTALKEYREGLWRMVYTAAIPKLALGQSLALLLAICITEPRKIHDSGLQDAVKAFLPEGTKIAALASSADVIDNLLALDKEALSRAMQQAPAHVSKDMSIDTVTGILKRFNVQLKDYWKVSEGFFTLLTRNEIEAVAEEIGIKAAMGVDYAKARTGSKPDFIKAILAVKDFEYRGRVPAIMNYA